MPVATLRTGPKARKEVTDVPRSMTRVLAVLTLVVGLSVAFADYNPTQDVHVNVNTGAGKKVTDALPIGKVGKTLFQAQEGVHNTVSKTTGTSVNHSYIWIGVNGQSVPVDPFTVSR